MHKIVHISIESWCQRSPQANNNESKLINAFYVRAIGSVSVQARAFVCSWAGKYNNWFIFCHKSIVVPRRKKIEMMVAYNMYTISALILFGIFKCYWTELNEMLQCRTIRD